MPDTKNATEREVMVFDANNVRAVGVLTPDADGNEVPTSLRIELTLDSPLGPTKTRKGTSLASTRGNPRAMELGGVCFSINCYRAPTVAEAVKYAAMPADDDGATPETASRIRFAE